MAKTSKPKPKKDDKLKDPDGKPLPVRYPTKKKGKK